MINRKRGEVPFELEGEPLTLCLTLGALAELEACYGGEDILSLADRFASGRIGAEDALNLLEAALKGGGNPVERARLAAMHAPGAMGAVLATLADLLQATFTIEAAPDGKAGDREVPSDPFPGSPSSSSP